MSDDRNTPRAGVRPRLAWRLRVMMAERDIRSVSELCRRLSVHGVTMSSQQMGRIVNAMPARLNTELFAALLAVLDCAPNDLLRRV